MKIANTGFRIHHIDIYYLIPTIIFERRYNEKMYNNAFIISLSFLNYELAIIFKVNGDNK